MRAPWLLMGASVLALLEPAIAQAQSAKIRSDETGTDIVVTAQKRPERLMDVPQSITALSGDELARNNATQLRDVAATVPALTFTTSGVGQSQLSLRGVTTGSDVGPTVGIYVDDVPYGSSSAFSNAASLGLDAGLFDLDRIEVLRGPQGTLYGASAMGGVLRYITPQPDLSNFRGTAQTGVSFTHHGGTGYNGAASVNTPLVGGKLGVRTSGFYSHDGGFIDNTILNDKNMGRSRVYGGRVDVLLKPSEEFSVRLTGFGQNIHRDGTSTADYDLSGQPIDGQLSQSRLEAEPFDQRFRIVSGTVGYDFGGAQLNSISSYQTVHSRYRMDISAVYVPLLEGLGLPFHAVAIDQARSTDKFTQEVRLGSSAKRTVEWIIGGFYTHEKSSNVQQVVPYDLSGLMSSTELGRASVPSHYEEIAGFGNLTVHLNDAFDVTGGLRYAKNNQSFEQIGSGLLFTSVPRAKSSDDVVTYLANARYRFGSNATLYARFATGYRPGGPNFLAQDPTTSELLAPTSFKADTLESYEIGFKGETADGTFGIDAALYHIDWKNIQAATAAGGLSVIVNAGSAKIDGAELTLRATPVREFTVTGAFAYQNARLADDEPLLGAVKGERLPNIPRYSVSLNADYRAEAQSLKPMLGGSLRLVSDRTASFDTNSGLPQYRLPSYVTIDMRTGVTLGPVDVRLFVRNLTDTRGQLSAQTSLAVLGGPAQVAMLQPRTIGLSVATRF